MNTETKKDKKTMAGLWVGVLVGATIAGTATYLLSPQTRLVIKTEVKRAATDTKDYFKQRAREEADKVENPAEKIR